MFLLFLFLSGLENITLDIEFMLGSGRTSMYWRFCWGLIGPAMMLTVFFYELTSFENLVYGGYTYPTIGYGKHFNLSNDAATYVLLGSISHLYFLSTLLTT